MGIRIVALVSLVAVIGCKSPVPPRDTTDSTAGAEVTARDECRPDPQECKALCERGDAASCVELGHMKQFGLRGLEANADEAGALFQRACDADYGRGCRALGHFLALGEDPEPVRRAFERAETLHRRACDAGSGRDCADLGELYAGTSMRPEHEGQILELYRKACDMGDGWGCVLLGQAYERAEFGVTRDRDRARAIFRTSCDRSYMPACTRLADITDDARAERSLLERACAGGHGLACENLAERYHKGRDTQRYRELLRKSCDLGDERACSKLDGTFREFMPGRPR